MTLRSFLASLFRPPAAKPKPCDLVEFDEARRRLRESGRKVAEAVSEHLKETDDAFGSMVNGMRARRQHCKSTSPSNQKKKRPRKSC